ncbi:monooxygenase, putative [Paecilomyces variotii No. 5]|uniref:Monooxygenase, putative n=1 Tax=Byssochlamys spectabilis (strain No. 5 / NBRC 109023) TaxID=1356009 RepID=V5FBN4_BYSSN|nr:monooxygenase, putative [Paecilomyces variotii No. 5]
MSNNSRPLRIAIIGGGPGGLGAAIDLSALPNIELVVYGKAHELQEIGAGIRIGYNCWKVLELLGVAGDVKGHLKSEVIHRNGLNGKLLKRTSPSPLLPLKYHPHRVRRTRLQSALLKHIPEGVIQLNKQLVSLENLQDGGVRLTFEDQTSDIADIVIGADGIRSVVREHAFPDHKIKFTGTTIWRALIPKSSISYIPDVSESTSWWHGPSGHAYFSPVDDGSETSPEDEKFEISVRYVVNPETDKERRFSWGIPATNECVEAHFKNYDTRVRETLAQVPEGQWKEFAAFAGPRLRTLTKWNKVVLIGDASHPLSGAFGSGAAFALEDGWILTRALEYTNATLRSSQNALGEALSIFDTLRSPYYLRMYDHLDVQKQKLEKVKTNSNGFESILQTRVESFGAGKEMDWIYGNDIEQVWSEWLENQNQDKNGDRVNASL